MSDNHAICNSLTLLLQRTIERVESGEITGIALQYQGRDGHQYLICDYGDIRIPDSMLPDMEETAKELLGKVMS